MFIVFLFVIFVFLLHSHYFYFSLFLMLTSSSYQSYHVVIANCRYMKLLTCTHYPFTVYMYTCRHNISREIWFCTNPTHRRLGKMVWRSVEIRLKSGLTSRFALYSAEVQRTFMLTYVLFMVVIHFFPQFSDGLGI